jgi:hypothetical protein
MKAFNASIINIVSITAAVVLSACGGGGDDTTSSAPTPATPTPTTCTPAANAATGYALVFKRCSGTVAEYFDKTECVRDNATGLIWEGKTVSSLRAGSNTYTNYDSDIQKQKGAAVAAPTLIEISAIDNSVGYRNIVANSNLCGFGNWRIPSKDEMTTLIAPGGSINATWFPNTPAEPFWTSTASTFGATLAVIVGFANGGVGDFGRGDKEHVRLVR